MKKFALIGGAVLFLLVVLKAVLVQMSTIPRALSHSSGTFELSAGQWVFVAALLLVGLATISLIGRGGKVATFALGLIVAAATAVVGGYLLFGTELSDVMNHFQKENAASARGERGVKGSAEAQAKVPENERVVGPIEFGGENEIYRQFSIEARIVMIPSGHCVEYSPQSKVTVLRSTSTFIELKPIEPVVVHLKAHQGGKPPCKS